MKLYELFDRILFSPDIFLKKKIEDLLRKTEFAPSAELENEGDVLDIELPTKNPGAVTHIFSNV